MTSKMLPPPNAVNMMYNLRNVKPGEPVEVFERDIESLKAEGWTSTEPDPEPEPEPMEQDNGD